MFKKRLVITGVLMLVGTVVYGALECVAPYASEIGTIGAGVDEFGVDYDTSELIDNYEMYTNTIPEKSILASEMQLKGEQYATESFIDNLSIEDINANLYAKVGMTADEFMWICRVAQREVNGAPDDAIANVVNVILNRVESREFKQNTIIGICKAPGQFTYTSKVKNSMKISVMKALLRGEDATKGALFFCTCEKCGIRKTRECTLTDSVGHSFYK